MTETAEKIVGFLKNLHFKKKIFGGVDPQDVLNKFSDLDKLYQAAFVENIGTAKEKIAALTNDLNSKQNEIKNLTAELRNLKEALTDSSAGTMPKEYRALESQLNTLRSQYEEEQALAAKTLLEKENQLLKEKLEQLIVANSKYSYSQAEYQALLDKANKLSRDNAELRKLIDERKTISGLAGYNTVL